VIFAERLAELRKELAGYRNGARWMRAEGYPHAAEGADQDAIDALAEIRILEAKAWGGMVINDRAERVTK
jgi:hypothetical protein